MKKEMAGKAEEKLYNTSFVLLLQGQLVSIFGDNVYDVALRFWILSSTGSIALMGVLMAAVNFPRIFISPFAGTYVDRHDRKRILVVADIIRGIAILSIGIAAILGFIKVWMVLVVGIIVGICGCFFSPAINSSIPDIVPKSKLIKANSAYSLISTGNDIAGNAFGGFLVQFFGAPIIFIFNGISFIFSATLECFMKIPCAKSDTKEISFFQDMKMGMNYVYNSKGLTNLYMIICFFNFCAIMSMTLTLPWFKSNNQLGIGFYGIAMAINTFGMFLGYICLSIIEIKKEKRFFALISSGIIISITMIIYSLTLNFYLICIMFFIDGSCIAVLDSLIQSSMQKSVPSNIRSKVFAFRSTLSSALMPIGMILAGILGEKLQMNIIILADYAVFLMLFIYLSFLSSVKEIINI